MVCHCREGGLFVFCIQICCLFMPIWILVHQKLFILSETMETSQDGKERSFKFRSCIDADHTRTFDLKSQPQPLTSSQRFFFTHEGKCQMFAFSEGAGCYFSWQAWAQQLETCSQVREADKVATPPPELFFFLLLLLLKWGGKGENGSLSGESLVL